MIPPAVPKPPRARGLLERSPAVQPYAYLEGGGFTGPAIPESPDPLVAYRWPAPRPSDPFQIYLLRPRAVTADEPASFQNLASLSGPAPNVTVQGTGAIRIDFGVESAAWIEFDSPDCPGDVEMSVSEYNEPGIDKTGEPVRHDHTYRLELNPELYDGVRYAWIRVKKGHAPWHITGVRAVCQVKPTNYVGAAREGDLRSASGRAGYDHRRGLGRSVWP